METKHKLLAYVVAFLSIQEAENDYPLLPALRKGHVSVQEKKTFTDDVLTVSVIFYSLNNYFM